MALTVDIEKTYGSFHLEVSFQAEQEVLALLGASGCGKSLTLKCIAGIERPDRGRIELDGRVLFDSAAGICLPPQKRRVGYLFQQYALFPHMTAEQNIASGMGNRLPRDRRRQRTAELMALLRLEDCAGKRPRQLSGGQQQRVALARILAAEPETILLDEPFSALDSHLKWQLELELHQLLSSFQGTVLWVSHDRGEVFRHCRRVCVLDRGHSSPVMEMQALMENPGTVSAARLSGCRNIVAFSPAGEGLAAVPDWGVTLPYTAPPRPGATHLGIRAQHVRAVEEGTPGGVRCRVVQVWEDVDAIILLLRPEKAREDAPLLHMEVPRGTPLPGDFLTVSLPPEKLLLLS